MSQHLISPSILTADFLHLESEIEMVNQSEADLLHLDIMDGVFVPNLSFGFPVIRQIKKVARKPLDVHLMIVDPDRYLEAYRDAGADWLTVHYETCTHLHRTIQKIRELGMKPAVSVNPHTDVSLLEPILKDLNMVLIMTVNPGFGGQKFIEGSWDKIRKLKKMIVEAGADTLIQVDGGVTQENIGALIQAGVDVFVVGNTIFSAENPSQATSNLKNSSQ
ncbi:MAG: ribulose-phosphate 3-epimerase [Bacteroidetes bacterium]|nr:MAG: ribulose-phosphate 3-epimerase [Bacteroidota bacterium]